VLVRRLMHMLLPIPDEHVYEFGANIGRNTIHIAKYLMTTGGKVTTFAPSVEICKVLKENVKSNGTDSCVTIMEGALSRTPQLFMEEFVAETEVSVTCIDTLIDRPTGLVFDCEGEYTTILREFPEIMERVRFVFCELDGSKDDTKKMIMFLHDQGLHEVFMNKEYAIFVAMSALKEVLMREEEEEEEGEEEVVVEEEEVVDEEEEKAKPKAKGKAKARTKTKAAVKTAVKPKTKATLEAVKPKAKATLEAATKVVTKVVKKSLEGITGR
jgi:FkbM family methyltransferase